MLEEIKKCRDDGLGLPEIVERIGQVCKADNLQPYKIDLLASRVAEVGRTEVYNFFRTEKDEG